jgi:hypothetical protein
MKLVELQAMLAAYPAAELRFQLPNGDAIPAHAHVTEVARLDKRFIDCGGTLRMDRCCRLQTWVAHDLDHRLHADKLLKILHKAAPVLETDDLEVDIEYQAGFISQFPLAEIRFEQGRLLFVLTERHTACLAEDKCLPKPSVTNIDFRKLPTFTTPASSPDFVTGA